MSPFNLSQAASELKGSYPNPIFLRRLLVRQDIGDEIGIIKLLLSEGVPKEFESCPMLYQQAREWLTDEIHGYNLSTKEITIVGSARLGYSLKPLSEFGRPFREESDLDFVIVSSALFAACESNANAFIDDYKNGDVGPKNERQKFFMPQDVDYLRNNLPKGFYQQGKVPNLPMYSVTKNLENSFWKLSQKLLATPAAPKFKKATFRVYKDWTAFVNQVRINLRAATKMTPETMLYPNAAVAKRTLPPTESRC